MTPFFLIKDVAFTIDSSMLYCSIEGDLSTTWEVVVIARTVHAGKTIRARFGSYDFIKKGPGHVRHWRDLDGAVVKWGHAFDPLSGRNMPKLHVLRAEDVYDCTSSLTYLSDARFDFQCEARCNVFVYPDLTWDQPLRIHAPMQFGGVLAGVPAGRHIVEQKLAQVFDGTLFEYLHDDFHRGHERRMLFRPRQDAG
jgi:hypothetical protein